jgi:hypothetical protein
MLQGNFASYFSPPITAVGLARSSSADRSIFDLLTFPPWLFVSPLRRASSASRLATSSASGLPVNPLQGSSKLHRAERGALVNFEAINPFGIIEVFIFNRFYSSSALSASPAPVRIVLAVGILSASRSDNRAIAYLSFTRCRISLGLDQRHLGPAHLGHWQSIPPFLLRRQRLQAAGCFAAGKFLSPLNRQRVPF